MCNKIFILFILFPIFIFSQSSQKRIDSLFNEETRIRKEGKLEEAILLCKKIVSETQKSGDKKNFIKAQIEIGNILSNQFRNKESLHYLKIASENIQQIEDKELEIRLLSEYARTYTILGFRKKSLEYYTQSISKCSELGNIKKKNFLLNYLYGCRAVLYEDNKNIPLYYHDIKKADSLSSNPLSASRIAKYFTVYQKNLDSAEYYLLKGERLFKTGKYPDYHNSILLRNFGRFYFEKKEYKKAISYYEESLLISKKENRKKDIRDTYKLLYEAHKAIKDKEKASEYLEKYSVINDSIHSYHRKAIDIPVNNILEEKEKESKKTKTGFYIIIVLLFILSFSLLIFYMKSKKRKQQQLQEKESIISQKEEEAQQLQLKVNESFEEVIQLAKDNSSEFWGRFQEVYPDFRKKLLSVNPDLKVSELILSAYIYLGFNTKDIAEYTFKAVKTIKNNKYNLRKRLDIPTKSDFTIWLREHVE